MQGFFQFDISAGVGFFPIGVHNTHGPGHLFDVLVDFVGVRHLHDDSEVGDDPGSGWSCDAHSTG